jgi:hypothetical protein
LAVAVAAVAAAVAAAAAEGVVEVLSVAGVEEASRAFQVVDQRSCPYFQEDSVLGDHGSIGGVEDLLGGEAAAVVHASFPL